MSDDVCPVDQLDDPIGYHVWMDAHRCKTCRGAGEVGINNESLPAPTFVECPRCQGEGVIEFEGDNFDEFDDLREVDGEIWEDDD